MVVTIWLLLCKFQCSSCIVMGLLQYGCCSETMLVTRCLCLLHYDTVWLLEYVYDVIGTVTV